MLSFDDIGAEAIPGAEPANGERADARVARPGGGRARPLFRRHRDRRVRVEDKRIINAQADVNQLVPFKYKWAWEKYPRRLRQPLDAQEINMSRDIALWKDPTG